MARRLSKQLDGYRLTVAEIFYRLPDHPSLLQTFVWQDYDLVPKYPVLHGFLTFWRENLEGELHSVRVASRELIAPDDIRVVEAQYTLQ
jgi:uncharacterized protein Usg